MSDAAAHLALAQRARDAGDFYAAAIQQRRAIALLRGDDWLALGRTIRHLAEILLAGGEVEEASCVVTELLALYGARSDVPPLERADALRCAAVQMTASGDDETARLFWAEARTQYEALEIGDGVAEADARIAALRG